MNRPGLALSGFTRYFAYKRMQVIGNAEAYYLRSLPQKERASALRDSVRLQNPVRRFQPQPARRTRSFWQAAEEAGVPIFQTPLVTMKFINLATLALEMMFAPRGTEMGSMVDILGVGVIIRGESGIGKSESVLALIERGYSLVADDVTKVTLVDGREVIGTSAELTRDHMEVRGIGIINVAAMFGVKSIRHEKRVDLVITLKSWNEVPDVDRLGMEQEFVEDPRRGHSAHHHSRAAGPRPGAAHRSRRVPDQAEATSGYNAAKELNERLIAHMADNRRAAEVIEFSGWKHASVQLNVARPTDERQKATDGMRVPHQGTHHRQQAGHPRPAGGHVRQNRQPL